MFYQVFTPGVSSNCLQTGFYIAESYPLLIYLEYPLLIAQELVLLFLAGRLSSSTTTALQHILGYLLLTTLVSVGLLPKALVLLILVRKSNPFGGTHCYLFTSEPEHSTGIEQQSGAGKFENSSSSSVLQLV